MKREVKFRGRRVDDTVHNGSWVYGHYFTPPLTDENSGLPAESGWFFLSGVAPRDCIEQGGVVYTIDGETRGQSTGLCDRHGVEIYEGDVVTLPVGKGYECMKAEIVWGFCGWEFRWLDKGTARVRRHETEPMFHNVMFFEVIGNIYEHPHLLGGEQK